MAIRKELIDELIATSGGSLIGPNGLVKELTGREEGFVVEGKLVAKKGESPVLSHLLKRTGKA